MRFIMPNIKKYFFIIFLLFFSCSENESNNDYIFKDLDILHNTNITISKGEHRVVNAVAKKLLKDEIQIYLKADYINTNVLRGKLYNAMSKNHDYIRISNLANQLHTDDGNIKAEFYNDNNILSSILYADSAQISNRYNNMIAKGNVVIYSPETNLMLLGDNVLWDNNAKRILSEEDVTIIKILDGSQCIQQSHGFESDMNLSNYIFYNIKGKISEGCF
tara:strand:- start:2144 stop:2800 length:657 start_codon:yes stop_codon:yes gene_type:complete